MSAVAARDAFCTDSTAPPGPGVAGTSLQWAGRLALGTLEGGGRSEDVWEQMAARIRELPAEEHGEQLAMVIGSLARLAVELGGLAEQYSAGTWQLRMTLWAVASGAIAPDRKD